MWKLKKKEEPIEEEQEEEVEQPKRLEYTPKPVKQKEKEEEFNKQEVIDVLQGNLHRSAQLLEILRGM